MDEDVLKIVVFVAIGIAILLLSMHQKAKRARSIKEFGIEYGFSFEHTPGPFHSKFRNFKLFDSGRSQSCTNLLSGIKDNLKVYVFDFSYVTGSGKNRTHYMQTVCTVCDTRLIKIPHFFLRRERSFIDFFGKMFGGQDINFPEDKEFSDSFVLQGYNEADTRQLFDSKIRKEFLRFKHSDYRIEGDAQTIVVHKDLRLDVEQIRNLIQDTLYIHDIIISSSVFKEFELDF